VHLHELDDVELWFLQHLHFADHAVAEGEHRRGLLRDGLADGVGDTEKKTIKKKKVMRSEKGS
jgi:hypothetical protein